MILTDEKVMEIAVIVAGIDEEYQISVLEGIDEFASFPFLPREHPIEEERIRSLRA